MGNYKRVDLGDGEDGFSFVDEQGEEYFAEEHTSLSVKVASTESSGFEIFTKDIPMLIRVLEEAYKAYN